MKESYERYWEDDKNWNFGVYSCPEDPRVIVPKKPKWAGRTLNFAHRKAAWAILATTLVIAILPASLVVWFVGEKAPEHFGFWVIQSLSVAMIILLYYRFEFRVWNSK